MSGKPINFISDRKFRWMSNFYGAGFRFDGLLYPTVEHAFQSLKTEDKEWSQKIRKSSKPGDAKRLGRQCPMRDDWDEIKDDVMYKLVRAKFVQNPELLDQLIVTGGRPIREDSAWDGYWGTGKSGKGRNEMGKILSRVRKELSREK